MKSGILKFSHVYTSALWGGTLVSRHFARTDAPAVCAESWEISGHRLGMSVVKEGPFEGWTLDRLVTTYGREFVGTKSPTADRFPLLFKLIDARWPLSLQIHPNNENASKTGGEPKTEAWFVVKAYPGATLYAGLKHPFVEQDLRAIVAQGPVLLDQLNALTVDEGDMLYIPGGTPHAIGGGCFIYEVQQTSDTTYRFYDWDRKDAEGKRRQLHIEESFKSLDYTLPRPQLNRTGELQSPYFKIRTVPLTYSIALKPDGSSFIAGFVLSGSTDVAGFGESFLLPATADEIVIRPTAPDSKLILTEL